ncbi:MAG: DUF1585 domain-containing protein [Myxococcota bacterium]
MTRWLLAAATCGWAGAGSTSAWAEDDPTCPQDGATVDAHRLLRALSLDLRGVVPDVADHELLDAAGEVPASLIDQWLDSPEFADQVVRRHRQLFWNNVSNITLFDVSPSLSSSGGIYYKRNSTDNYRGVFDETCGDFAATFDAVGRPITRPDPVLGGVQEGYVELAPYWSPGSTVKVCAFDAQSAAFSPAGTDCSSSEASNDPGCGCGPDLRWCALSSEAADITAAMGEDIDRRVSRIVTEDRSYLELLTGDTGYVNGPLAYFLKYQTGVSTTIRFTESPVDPDTIPDLAFDDADTWVEIPLGEDHAGVLTSPGYLLRFMTNRSRANRFYSDFLCQPFQPPEGGLPASTGALPTLDLTRREGCSYCHALLEPAAAHWGRWTTSGGGHLDPDLFPSFDPSCAQCGQAGTTCSATCDRYYVTDALGPEETPYLGWLKSYEFLEPDQQTNVELGPEWLVDATIADGRLPRCVAERTADWLLGRETTDADLPWLDALAAGFAASGYRYDQLVKDIVTSDAYRRIH